MSNEVIETRPTPQAPTVTIEWLREHGACANQLAVARREWGDTIPITAATLERARELQLDVDWWARRWLPAPLRAEYDRQEASLWAEYDRRVAPIWAEYERQRAPLRAEYERQRAPLQAEYDRQAWELLLIAIKEISA